MAEGSQDRIEEDDFSSGVNGEAGNYFVAYRKSANVLSLLSDSDAGDQDE
jgi:hypothetical protein